MGFSLRGGDEGGATAVSYCVVPRDLEGISPDLREYFAWDPRVEVVVDRRVTERRGPESAEPPAETWERRTIDGRRTAVPVKTGPPLPPQLRRFKGELEFRAAGDDGWKERCIAAEQQAAALATALHDATRALRSRRGLSPLRFLQLIRAEEAIGRYNRWRSRTSGPGTWPMF